MARWLVYLAMCLILGMLAAPASADYGRGNRGHDGDNDADQGSGSYRWRYRHGQGSGADDDGDDDDDDWNHRRSRGGRGDSARRPTATPHGHGSAHPGTSRAWTGGRPWWVAPFTGHTRDSHNTEHPVPSPTPSPPHPHPTVSPSVVPESSGGASQSPNVHRGLSPDLIANLEDLLNQQRESSPVASGQGHQPAYTTSDQGHQPVYTTSGQDHQPVYTTSGQGHQPAYTTTDQGHQPVYTTSGQGHQPVYTTSGPGHQPVYTTTGQDHQPVYTTSGQGHQPAYTTSDQGHQPVYTTSGQGHQPVYTTSGQGHQPAYTTSDQGHQPIPTISSRRPHHPTTTAHPSQHVAHPSQVVITEELSEELHTLLAREVESAAASQAANGHPSAEHTVEISATLLREIVAVLERHLAVHQWTAQSMNEQQMAQLRTMMEDEMRAIHANTQCMDCTSDPWSGNRHRDWPLYVGIAVGLLVLAILTGLIIKKAYPKKPRLPKKAAKVSSPIYTLDDSTTLGTFVGEKQPLPWVNPPEYSTSPPIALSAKPYGSPPPVYVIVDQDSSAVTADSLSTPEAPPAYQSTVSLRGTTPVTD